MGKEGKFTSLTPEILSENQGIYKEALDFAFSNNDIKNIAITGIYGAGKSSVWKTYEQQEKLKNVITVSLGKYEDKLDDEVTEERQLKEVEDESENRVEKQLINQILSQIPIKKIPLSKYRFKQNKNEHKLFGQIFLTILFLVSIILWILKDDSTLNDGMKIITGNYASIWILGICFIGFIIPLSFFLYGFYKENKIRLSRINFKGAEANLNEDDNKDESILDRDIKEIVYALSYSNTDVVVFEDLDRYENITIFTKLRELNFLVNAHLKMKNEDRVVRFVYMLRDGLFISKNRTKFFDFILPIVPIIDSKNSENKLIELFDGVENIPSENTFNKISLYIDDMRVLKNIINEFNVYINIIAFEELSLEADKLLALIVFKNIFPREFDLLQEDKGFVYKTLKNINEYRGLIINQLNKKNEQLSKEIAGINKEIDSGRLKVMAELIPSNVALRVADTRTWVEVLTDWEAKPTAGKSIVYGGSYSSNIRYDEFIETYILKNEDNKSMIDSFKDHGHEKEIQKRMESIDENKSKEEEILTSSIRDLMMMMSVEDTQNIFTDEKSELTKNHYFPLIKYLILDGLLDETYRYYKGYFHEGSLGKNDTVFMKNLLEGVEQDILLDLESPEEVINRLDKTDYRRYNILNKSLLEKLLLKNKTEEIQIIIDTLDNHNLYSTMISILDSIDYELIKLFVSMIFDKDTDILSVLIDAIGNDYSNVFIDVLLSLYTRQGLPIDKLSKFNPYIEVNENIITEVQDTDLEIFLNNIGEVNAKFQNLNECNSDRNMLEKISRINAYRLNVNNIKTLLNSLIDQKVDYGEWISTIFNDEKLTPIKDYIERNFEGFIEEYINSKSDDAKFTNLETETVMILESQIELGLKLDYVRDNETVIIKLSDSLTTVDEGAVMLALFNTNKVAFASDNINKYWNSFGNELTHLVRFFNRNITKENGPSVLKECQEICKELVKDHRTSENAFDIIYKFVDSVIEDIGEDISEERILKLISKEIILINEENLSVLLSSQYMKAIVLLANQSDNEEFTSLIISSSKLLELIDTQILNALIDSEIDENIVVKIIDATGVKIEVSSVPNKKTIIMEYVLSNGLTSEDIEFILFHFSEFPLKDELMSTMTNEGIFDELSDNLLGHDFMTYTLSSNSVTIDIKIRLIVRAIRFYKDENIIVEYLNLVDEIQDLTSAFYRKRPSLDNQYKTIISEALYDAGFTNRAESNRLIIKQEYLIKSIRNNQ